MNIESVTTADRALMRRAISIGARGPAGDLNPQVGCVVAGSNGEVLSEGWHRGVGTMHAEVDALSRLLPSQARGGTAYVSLEPCNHWGHTGPCALSLIGYGVSRVFYALADPGEASSGGAERLRRAGVEVVGGLEQKAAEAVLADWLRLQSS